MTTTPTNLGVPWQTPSSASWRSCSLLLVRTRHHTRPSRPLPPLWAGTREARGLGHLLAGRITRQLTTNEEPAMTTTTTRPTTGEPSAPADGNVLGERPGIPGRGRWLTLGLLVSAQFVVMLDTSIVNVALPSIQADLGLGAADATWIVNAYVVAFGGLLLLSGRLADLFGRRGMFTAGSVLFTVGTLLAAAAADQGLLLAGRVVQGVGAAALSPAAMSLLMLAFPGQTRARAMSIWGAASTLGGATGVALGGLLAGSLGWRSVFLVTVPISVVAVVVARHVLPRSAPGPRRRFDWGGAASITAAVVVLVHGALFAADLGWTARPDRRESCRRGSPDGELRDRRASDR